MYRPPTALSSSATAVDEPRPEWGGERFPPTVRPAPEDEQRVVERWKEYGLEGI